MNNMEFDEETVNGFKQIITDGLAYGTFLDPAALSVEVDGKHIANRLFQNPPHMIETTLKLLEFYISRANVKSVISFTENDQALTSIVAQTCYKMEIPFFVYDLENDQGADSQFVRPEVVPCSVIIPYSINENQVLEIIGRFEQQKVSIKQVIAMVEENPMKSGFSGKIEYLALSDWNFIKNRVKSFKNLTDEKMKELLANFC